MASSNQPIKVWQDRDLKFDAFESQLQPCPGEIIIDYLGHVEDTKGNNGDKGKLYVTNLRLIWVSGVYPRVNLSIGFRCIKSISSRKANSRLRGQTEALYVLTKIDGTHFEFIFTNLVADSPRLFSTVMAVHRAYETSMPYRELKLRSAILQNKELILLPREQLYTKLSGVWNLCSDQGTLGTMYVTNVRVVWYSNMNEGFNISIPYLQMGVAKIRDSKFGVAMVLETTKESGSYVLGFRIDPYEKMKDIVQEIHSLYQAYHTSPIFGVDFELQDQPESTAQVIGEPPQEDVEVVQAPNQMDTFAAYLADPHKPKDREPVYDPEMGLAIEKLPEGYSLSDLWNVS